VTTRLLTSSLKPPGGAVPRRVTTGSLPGGVDEGETIRAREALYEEPVKESKKGKNRASGGGGDGMPSENSSFTKILKRRPNQEQREKIGCRRI